MNVDMSDLRQIMARLPGSKGSCRRPGRGRKYRALASRRPGRDTNTGLMGGEPPSWAGYKYGGIFWLSDARMLCGTGCGALCRCVFAVRSRISWSSRAVCRMRTGRMMNLYTSVTVSFTGDARVYGESGVSSVSMVSGIFWLSAGNGLVRFGR